jgi:hypothetical protein
MRMKSARILRREKKMIVVHSESTHYQLDLWLPYNVIAGRFWAIFLQAPRVTEHTCIHFGDATRG